MIKALIFDISGVVTFDDYHQIYHNFAKRVGLPLELIPQFFKDNWTDLLLANINLQQIFDAFIKAGANKELDLKSVWLEEALKIRKINKELIAILEELKKHYIIGALTNLTPTREMVDEHLNIYQHFHFALLSCREHIKKPDPKFYEMALKKSGAAPTEAVFIDDNPRNVTAAKALGLNDILFTDNQKLLADLNQLGIAINQ